MSPKNLVLILARGLADELSSATFLVDATGRLVFYNEAAEQILGKPFAATGEVSQDEWVKTFHATDLEDTPLPEAELPLVHALTHRSPSHRTLRLHAADDEVRDISVTAFPLFAGRQELVGAVAIFWEHAGASSGDGGR